MSVIQDFTNDKFELLDYMVGIRKNDNGVYITQDEIGHALSISRVSINQDMKFLKENGYVIQDPKHRGRYYLPERSIEIVNIINQLKTIK